MTRRLIIRTFIEILVGPALAGRAVRRPPATGVTGADCGPTQSPTHAHGGGGGGGGAGGGGSGMGRARGITEALAAQARAASRFPAQVAAKRPSAVTKGAASSTSRAAAASVAASATCKLEPESRRNLKPTKPAIQISDADRKRRILITGKLTMAFKKWGERGESFRVDRYRSTALKVHHIMSAKTKVTKTKTALKQETYNLSDLKHDLQCGFVELGGSVSVSS